MAYKMKKINPLQGETAKKTSCASTARIFVHYVKKITFSRGVIPLNGNSLIKQNKSSKNARNAEKSSAKSSRSQEMPSKLLSKNF